MKICFFGIDLPAGKIKYNDPRMARLVERFAPLKVSPFFAELIADDFNAAEAIAVAKDKILDLLVLDMEKIESRLNNSNDEAEKAALKFCLHKLEEEIPVCDIQFPAGQEKYLKELSPLSLKPTLAVEGAIEPNDLIAKMLEKSKTVFFYTAGKKEVRAWPVKDGLDIVSCAGKIHSDLARGFIKADIVGFDDFMSVHNMHEAREKNFVKLVDRDYKIVNGDIIEIRFNV